MALARAGFDRGRESEPIVTLRSGDRPAVVEASQPHDSLFRYAFGLPEHAAGILAHVLPASIAGAIDWSGLRRVAGSFVDEELRQHHSDLLFEASWIGNARVLVYLLFEHQSREDRFMPLRLVRYQLRIWEQERRERPESEHLPLILPVVLYHATRRWQGPLELDELIAIEPVLRGAAPAFLLRQRFFLLDLSTEDARTLRSVAASVFARVTLFLMRYASRARELQATLDARAPLLRQVSRSPGREAVRALARSIESVNEDLEAGQLWPLFETKVDPVWGSEMATLEQKVRQEGREEGRVAGQRELLRVLIRDRFGEIPAEFDARLERETSATLERIARRLLTVDRLTELFDDPHPEA